MVGQSVQALFYFILFFSRFDQFILSLINFYPFIYFLFHLIGIMTAPLWACLIQKRNPQWLRISPKSRFFELTDQLWVVGQNLYFCGFCKSNGEGRTWEIWVNGDFGESFSRVPWIGSSSGQPTAPMWFSWHWSILSN